MPAYRGRFTVFLSDLPVAAMAARGRRKGGRGGILLRGVDAYGGVGVWG